MPHEPTPNVELVAIPDRCVTCFFAKGVVAATNRTAAELLARQGEEGEYVKLLKARYVGGCLLREDIDEKCGGATVVVAAGEPVMTMCGFLRRMPVRPQVIARETADSDQTDVAQPQRRINPYQ